MQGPSHICLSRGGYRGSVKAMTSTDLSSTRRISLSTQSHESKALMEFANSTENSSREVRLSANISAGEPNLSNTPLKEKRSSPLTLLKASQCLMSFSTE